jgi:hypothetical protein
MLCQPNVSCFDVISYHFVLWIGKTSERYIKGNRPYCPKAIAPHHWLRSLP